MKKLERIVQSIQRELLKLKPMLREFVTKAKNVEGNNYALGLKHFESGNLHDAQFRFWLVTKLNPKHSDAKQKLGEVRAAIAKADA